MNWTLLSNELALVHEFHLAADGVDRMVIKINPLHQSVRLKAGSNRRLIFLDQTAAASGKFTLCDEYGMEIGNMLIDKWYNNRGSVTIDKVRYFFQQQNTNNKTELVIYQNDIQHPMLTCQLPTNAEPSSFHEKATEADNHCMLLSLCWYLSLPAVAVNAEPVFAMQY